MANGIAATPYRATSAAPRVRDASIPFARALEEASLCEIVNLDVRTGAVRPPGRRVAIALAIMPALGIAAIVGLDVIANLVSGFDVGQTMAGIIIGGTFLAIGIWMAKSVRATMAAGALVNAGKLDDAEAILRQWTGMRAMGAGDLYLGAVASLRGEHTRAIDRYRAVAAFYGSIGQVGIRGATNLVGLTREGTFGRRPNNPQVLIGYLEAAYHAPRALCNAGRIDEARQLLADAGPPIGEYLTLLRAVSSLYADLCAGTSTIPDDELAGLASQAARLEGTWGLFGLCAWAYAQRGDAVTSRSLVEEELRRPNANRLEQLMPALHAWMRAGA